MSSKYKFSIINGLIAGVYEYDDGIFKKEDIEYDESWTYDALTSTVTLTQHSGSSVIFSDLDGDGIYEKSGYTSVSTGLTDPSTQTVLKSDHELYKISIENDVVVSVSEYEHGYWEIKKIDVEDTWSVNPDGTINKIEDQGNEIKIYSPQVINGEVFYSLTGKMDSNGQSVFEGDEDDVDGDGSDNDLLYGSNTDDYLSGGIGDDEIETGDGDDFVDGGEGSDILLGGAGSDDLNGGDGDDILSGGANDDDLDGGLGIDTVNYGDVNADLDVDLSAGTATGDGLDTLNSVENVIGGSGNDLIDGNSDSNEILGGAGNDVLNGYDGNDLLYAADGNDTVDAGSGDDLIVGGDGKGNDKYIGGTGIDTVKYTSAAAGISVNLFTGVATSIVVKDAAKIGIDALSGIENVIAGNYNDIIKGNTGSNTLTGGLGSDNLYGGADKVRDVFDFNDINESKLKTARDKIYDFVSGIDDIDLATIDANTKVAGDQSFKSVSAKPAANSVWYTVSEVDGLKSTKDIVVYGDVNGDAKADFEIGLVGVTAVTAADFIL